MACSHWLCKLFSYSACVYTLFSHFLLQILLNFLVFCNKISSWCFVCLRLAFFNEFFLLLSVVKFLLYSKSFCGRRRAVNFVLKGLKLRHKLKVLFLLDILFLFKSWLLLLVCNFICLTYKRGFEWLKRPHWVVT